MGALTMKAVPTLYAGIRMRSRLEASVAQLLDSKGYHWEYEPECFGARWHVGQYRPDFEVWTGDRPSNGAKLYVEVKPHLDDPRERSLMAAEALRTMHVILEEMPLAALQVLTLAKYRDVQFTSLGECRADRPCGKCDRGQPAPSTSPEPRAWQVGDQVRHPDFGLGVIEAMSGTGEGSVVWDLGGWSRLPLATMPLEFVPRGAASARARLGARRGAPLAALSPKAPDMPPSPAFMENLSTAIEEFDEPVALTELYVLYGHRPMVRAAVQHLGARGYVDITTGPRGSKLVRSRRPYRKKDNGA